MDNSKFEGYYIMGTKTQEEANKGQGLIVWIQSKPSFFNRFYNKLFLGIRWVDKDVYENYIQNRTVVDKIKDDVATEFKRVVMPKRKIYKKSTDDRNKARANTGRGTESDQV